MLSLLVAAVAVGQTPRPLAVTPAADPRPALRYELLPPHHLKQPGNAALSYFRAFASRPRPANPAAAKARNDAFEKWPDAPLDQLPKDEVRKFLTDYRRTFADLDRAVLADHCDWGTLPRLAGPDGLDAVMEVQQARDVLAALSLRTRLELAEGRFDAAADSLRAGFQLAKHVGEGPTQLPVLVGLALEGITLQRVEDWIARPGSPNLYWPLTDLPRPLIDPRPGLRGEQAYLESRLPNLVRLRAGPVPKDQAADLADRVMADLRNLGGEPPAPDPIEDALAKTVGRVGLAVVVAQKLPAARTDLLALGRTAVELDAMPPAQIVFLASLERFVALRDDYWKWVGGPYHRAHPELKTLAARVEAERAAAGIDPFFVLLTMALPATEKAIWAAARTDRRVQALRAIEAIRLDAAAHGGTPPANLSDITVVPIPDDPVTGQPFGYQVKGNVVTLSGGPPAGEKAGGDNALLYEITFAGPLK